MNESYRITLSCTRPELDALIKDIENQIEDLEYWDNEDERYYPVE